MAVIYDPIVQSRILNKESNFVITSYWWGRGNLNKNSRDQLTYDQLADRFINSCVKNKCNYYVAEYPMFAQPGGYQKAINYKATFIKYALDDPVNKGKNVVYIDTDMLVEKFPSLFEEDYDFMGYNWNWEPRSIFGVPIPCFSPFTIHTSGGIQFFGQTPPSRALLDAWEDEALKYPGKADDRLLGLAFNKGDFLRKCRCLWLPMEYFWIPYFYEVEDYYNVDKKYQPFFKKNGVKFRGTETVDEITLGKLYGVKRKSIVISHPEALTSEELAAKQGADPNRVPKEWFEWDGRRKRCQPKTPKQDMYIDNPALYLDTKKNVKVYDTVGKIQQYVGLAEYKTRIPGFKHKSKTRLIVSEYKRNQPLLLVCVSHKGEALQMEKEIIGSMKKEGFSYAIYLCNGKVYLPDIINKALKKCPQCTGVLSLKGGMTANGSFAKVLREIANPEVDFSSLNAYAFPVYNPKMVGPLCQDDRILNCPSDSILWCANTRHVRNFMNVWDNEINSKMPVSQALSRAFNRYSAVSWLRVSWISPRVLGPINKKEFIRMRGISPLLQSDAEFEKVNLKVNMVNYKAQCVKAPSTGVGEEAKTAHYTTKFPKTIKGIKL